MDRLSILINEFWHWTKLPRDKWDITDIGTLPTNPVEFPKIGQICDVCINMINTPLQPKDIHLFLMGLAIDSEDEDILDECKRIANCSFLYEIIASGITHPQPEARWQLAELLRYDIPQREYFLNLLLVDSNEYVQKRAHNVISDVVYPIIKN